MAKTLIIGAVNNYGHTQVKNWVKSIRKNAPNCDVALLAYNMKKDDVEKIKDYGLTRFFGQMDDEGNFSADTNPSNFNVVVERFAHLWKLLSETKEYDYVATTDVKDVIFQNDPTQFLMKSKDVVVGSEWLKYSDEPWNKNNMNLAYGETMYNYVSDMPIYCAGVIAGKRQAVADFCLNIYFICRATRPHIQGGGGPDQAAMNILLRLSSYVNHIEKTDPESNFIAHLGTSLQAIENGSGGIGETFKANPNLLDTYKKNSLYDQHSVHNNKIVNCDNEEYTIVHQYDRVAHLKEMIYKLYGDDNAS